MLCNLYDVLTKNVMEACNSVYYARNSRNKFK